MILIHASLILLLNCIPYVILLKFEKPVAEKLWRQRCVRNALVLNDCNWCWCNDNFRYTCNAKVCGEVDMFGHFNDAIQNIDVGMEGHGSWRTTSSACEPGVHYNREDLLCVCTEDGVWPNPVCRDIFRVLHPIEVIKDFELSEYQTCSPTKLYLAECNVCICPSTGHIDPSLCTQNKCTENNIISTRSVDTEVDEIYAECHLNQKYKLGCKNCICLRNNRLLCDNCTNESKCAGKRPGENFNVDCNTCHCDDKGTIYCTLNRCLHSQEQIEEHIHDVIPYVARTHTADLDCVPGTRYMKDCNTCYCFQTRGKLKKYGCTVKKCHQSDTTKDCVIGSKFSSDCVICRCEVYNHLKMLVCQTDPKCVRQLMRMPNLKEFKQECVPKHVYTNDCNTCQCSADGHSVLCTQKQCKDIHKPISLNIIPVAQKLPTCPKGHSYKIDCNFCFCLSNGNAICTTMDCKTKIK